MSHTPTPWQHRTAIGIVDGDNELIADTYKSPYALDAIIANAAHIVHCVNVHDQLVAALRLVDEKLGHKFNSELSDIVDEALAAAEKGA